MASTFTWLDYSEQDRRSALEVIDLFREEDTRDELGLGVIRDALSDLLFPGTTTIQTRARYFLFVPWVLKTLEERGTSSTAWRKRSREWQWRLCRALMAGGEVEGVVGFRAGLDVQRLPHEIYWQGLRRWGILRFPGSIEDYRASLDRQASRQVGMPATDDGEPVDVGAEGNWDPHLPVPPEGFLDAATFDLTADEAAYLEHRVAMRAGGSLLDHLLQRRLEVDRESRFPWDVVEEAELDPALRSQLLHARCFSESLHGAALLYNLMLAEQKDQEPRVEEYRAWLAEWWGAFSARDAVLRQWDRRAFWQVVSDAGGRVPPAARSFVASWWHALFGATRLEAFIGDSTVRQLIEGRERQLKKARARLNNPRALELWRGASGTAQLDYRWKRPVRAMVNDIALPLSEGGV